MNNTPRRTLVVSHDFLDGLRDELQRQSQIGPTNHRFYAAQVAVVDRIIQFGTTVDMDHDKVAGFAQALVKAGRERQAREIAEPEWAAKERAPERYYSEADAVDAEWMPSGGPA